MIDFSVFDRSVTQDFRRGLLKLLLMRALESKEMHGYALMERISIATDGQWKPSPGSIYPALRGMEREGLISPRKAGGRVVYKLTDEGRRFSRHLRENVNDYIVSITAIFDKV